MNRKFSTLAVFLSVFCCAYIANASGLKALYDEKCAKPAADFLSQKFGIKSWFPDKIWHDQRSQNIEWGVGSEEEMTYHLCVKMFLVKEGGENNAHLFLCSYIPPLKEDDSWLFGNDDVAAIVCDGDGN